MMKTTYPLEFCRDVNFLVVILGSNKAIATIEEIITKRVTKMRVIEVWNRCQPCQHVTSGKLVIAVTPFALA